jgi:hypothetical protein
MTTLAKRAVACAAWRWMPGMLTENGIRVVRGEEGVDFAGSDRDCPDLTDPATRGCLLELVRQAWPEHPVAPRREPAPLGYKPWRALTRRGEQWTGYVADSEQELLVLILEAAGRDP